MENDLFEWSFQFLGNEIVSRSGYDKDKEVIIADSFARGIGDNPRFSYTPDRRGYLDGLPLG